MKIAQHTGAARRRPGLPTTFTRRAALGLGALLLLGACAQPARQAAPQPGPQAAPQTTAATATANTTAPGTHPPILFLHGNGDSAAQWQSQLWRFESNGWPRERLFALQHPYPLARSADVAPQGGRSSTDEQMAFLSDEVARVRRLTGAQQVVLMANSRGGHALRHYVQEGGGAETVSHAVLGGTPNHGVHAIPGFFDGSQFSGLSPFLQRLNRPKNAAGDEVTGPVRWLTLRSDRNDFYAQPHGDWIGRPGQSSGVGHDSPALKGALNAVLPGADHRETSYSAAAFEQSYRFITGQAPRTLDILPEARVLLSGLATGLGVDPLDPGSGGYVNNLPLPGARVEVFAVDADSGARQGPALLDQTVARDGRWGPLEVPPGRPLELVVSAPGYAITHYYRSGFARGSEAVVLQARRLPVADAHAPSVVVLWRPRGYLDPGRRMSFDGAAPPAVPSGARVAWSKLTPGGGQRPIEARFEGERVVGQTWPAKDGHMVYLELTH